MACLSLLMCPTPLGSGTANRNPCPVTLSQSSSPPLPPYPRGLRPANFSPAIRGRLKGAPHSPKANISPPVRHPSGRAARAPMRRFGKRGPTRKGAGEKPPAPSHTIPGQDRWARIEKHSQYFCTVQCCCVRMGVLSCECTKIRYLSTFQLEYELLETSTYSAKQQMLAAKSRSPTVRHARFREPWRRKRTSRISFSCLVYYSVYSMLLYSASKGSATISQHQLSRTRPVASRSSSYPSPAPTCAWDLKPYPN